MIINPSDIEQIITNGEQEIARLTVLLADYAQRIASYDEASKKFMADREARHNEIVGIRADVATKQDATSLAMASAKQAHGTPLEASADKAFTSAKKALDTAQTRLKQLIAKHTEATDKEQESMNELLDLRRQGKADQQRLANELRSAEEALAQVLRQQDEQKLAAFLQAYAERERRVDELAGQLVEAKAARLDLHSDAIQALSGHPDLQARIEERRPLDNATTRLFEATLWYLDAFMANAHEVEKGVKLPSLRIGGNGSHQDIWQFLIIHPPEFSNWLQRRPEWTPPPTMPALRERLQQLLDEYRVWQAEQSV